MVFSILLFLVGIEKLEEHFLSCTQHTIEIALNTTSSLQLYK